MSDSVLMLGQATGRRVMPRKSAGAWKQGVRHEKNGTWTAKHAQLWSRGHPTRDAALAAKAELANRREEKRSGRETVGQWAERWLAVKPRPAETTNMYYRERVKPFVEEFGLRRLSSLTVEECHGYALEFPNRAKAVKVMFADAARFGVDGLSAESNPWRAVVTEGRSEGRRRINPLTRDEVDKLVRIAEESYGEWGRSVYGALILTFAWTGMRPAEAFALEWRDVDFDGGTVHVRRQWRSKTGELVQYTKTGSRREPRDRFVPLAPPVVEALRGIVRRRDHVFYTGQDFARFKQMSNVYYWGPVRDVFTAGLPEGHWLRERIRDAGAGLPNGKLDPYELRHFFASELYRRQVHIGDIAKMLGHVDEGELAKTTYVHVSPEEARERVRAALWREPEVVEPSKLPNGKAS